MISCNGPRSLPATEPDSAPRFVTLVSPLLDPLKAVLGVKGSLRRVWVSVAVVKADRGGAHSDKNLDRRRPKLLARRRAVAGTAGHAGRELRNGRGTLR